MPHFADVCVVTRTFFTSNLGKDGGSRLTPVVENRDRFKLFGVGVFAISPPERRGAAAAAREGVPPSSPSRAPPGKAECVEGSLSNLGDVLGTRPDRAARALGEDMVVVVFLCCRY